MDVIELRFEALQAHLRACREKDVEQIEVLNALGRELTARAEELEREAV